MQSNFKFSAITKILLRIPINKCMNLSAKFCVKRQHKSHSAKLIAKVRVIRVKTPLSIRRKWRINMDKSINVQQLWAGDKLLLRLIGNQTENLQL